MESKAKAVFTASSYFKQDSFNSSITATVEICLLIHDKMTAAMLCKP